MRVVKARSLHYDDLFTQLQSTQDLLAEKLGVCLALVDAKGREITLPSGLPLSCNEHVDCPACHAQFIAQLDTAGDYVLGLCPNSLYLAALETSIRKGDGALYLLVGRTKDRAQTENQIECLRSIYTLPFETPFPGRKGPTPAQEPSPPQASLTTQEQRVLGCIVAGLPNKDIASHLCISESTVKTHVTNILKKLNLSNRTEASTYALKNGIQFGDQP